MNNKFKRIIELKKQKGSNRKPRYATRKLSIGLVSCILGYALLVSPSSVEASELDSNNQAVVEAAETTETKEESITNKEIVSEEKPAETHSEKNKEISAKETTTENKEAVIEEKEAFILTDSQRQDLKNSNFTDSEIEKIEENISNKLDVDASLNEQELVNEKLSEKTPALEKAEKVKPEAVEKESPTREPKDVSDEITEANVSIGNTQTSGVLNSGAGEGLAWSVSFKAPDDTKAGDYFIIRLSDNWTLKGIEPDTTKADPIVVNGKEIATGERLSRQEIKYTFNKNIDNLNEVRVQVQYGGYDVKEKIQNSQNQTFTINVGNTSDSKDLYVDYGQVNYDEYQRILNGTSQYTHFDSETGDFTQVFYINPDSRYIGYSTGENFNGSVGVVVDNRGFDHQPSDAYFTDENTSVEIVEVPQGTEIPDAVYENPVKGQDAQGVNPVYNNGNIYIDFNRDGINNPYIITVKSKFDPNVEYINLGSRATLYGNGNLDLGLVNQIQIKTGNTGGSGVEEKGSFQEHHVYITKDEDGNIIEEKTIKEDGKEKEGTK
ncbi:Ig-like domain-containing protein, partial [Anaerococcus hydrogenalis]|uniref:Ig-like domain-containing protein n=1 Tax=Anaerococcus hydrogenalis TaxID=33029 RepID=UPI002904A173